MKIAVFLICSGVGYLLGHYLPDPWATYASILISYHLFLAWLVITAEHDAGFSLPVLPTILMHTACLVVLVGLGVGRRYVPFLGMVRMFVPALAPFEVNWLFRAKTFRSLDPSDTDSTQAAASTAAASTSAESTAGAQAAAVEPAPQMEYTADDDAEWRRYLSTPHRAFRKPGLSVGDELKLWLAARAQAKTVQPENKHPE